MVLESSWGAHKDAVAGGRVKVRRLLRRQAKLLVGQLQRRLRQRERVAHQPPGRRARAILYGEAVQRALQGGSCLSQH